MSSSSVSNISNNLTDLLNFKALLFKNKHHTSLLRLEVGLVGISDEDGARTHLFPFSLKVGFNFLVTRFIVFQFTEAEFESCFAHFSSLNYYEDILNNSVLLIKLFSDVFCWPGCKSYQVIHLHTAVQWQRRQI